MLLIGMLAAFPVAAAGLIPCNGLDCSFCDLLQLGSNIINWLIQFSVVAATIMIVYGGIKLVLSQGNPGNVKESLTVIRSAIIGLAIVFAAWLIVGTVIQFINNSPSKVPWNEIQCSSR